MTFDKESPLPKPQTPNTELCQHIANNIHEHGYCLLNNALPAHTTTNLHQRISNMPKEDFSQAGIGRRENFQHNQTYRSDRIHWLNANQHAEAAYLTWMEHLRLGLNRELFMGLYDYEAHFAHYTKGAFYKRHLDAFQGNTNRILTTVFYLNPQWKEANGGQLLIYQDTQTSTPMLSILPQIGTLVIFLSDQFPHEVLAAQQDRYSIAGWFRVKAAGGILDPAF